MSQPDIQSFLQNLDRSRLLGAETAVERWQKVCTEDVEPANAESLAAMLVQKGTLTGYQADKLLRGSTRFFLDDYKLLETIGSGRMAGVYRAIHKLGMPVAAKILPPSSAKRPEVLARFQREAELAMQLDHPHVVKTYHAGVSEGLHYIAMEFLEGETLEERLKSKGKLPTSDVLRVADQTLQALGHLHDKGMVHRDVKPGNLMLVSLPGAPGENSFSVKLLDVGLGRALFTDENEPGDVQELTAAGELIGTPDYTAPEQSRDSHAADIRSDMYSLACVLYECLTGRVPFPDKNLVNKLVKHAQEMPPPLDANSDPAAPPIQAWLWKLMAKKPADRFQTPAEAAAALQSLLRVKPPVVQRSTNVADESPFAVDVAPAPRSIQPQPKLHAAPERQVRPVLPVTSPPARKPAWKYVAIGSGGFLLLVVLSYALFTAMSGPSKPKSPTDDGKQIASVPPSDNDTRTPKDSKKDVKPVIKKTPSELKDPPKKAEPEPKDLPKKTEPEPKDPPKKTEPEPKDPPKKTEPEPKDTPKLPDMKKEPVVVAAPPDERAAVPSADEIAKAEAVVRNLLKAEYAKTKTADRLALAAKLMEEAAGTKDNAARFVMLRDARNIAAGAGNGTLAFTAAGEIATDFQISAGKASAAAADLIAVATLTPAAASESTDAIFIALDAAHGAEDWPSAVALARSAEVVARKSHSAVLTTMAQTKLKEAETMKVAADKVKDHIATLKSNPDDPAANLAVGRFRCLIKQDWESGLEMLAKGTDELLKAAAENDLKAGSGNETDRAAAGDSWYDLSRTADPSAKFAMQSRAHLWYNAALGGLTGLDKLKAEKRVAELQAVLAARGGSMKRWMANRQAIVGGLIKKWDLVGGSPAMKEFELVPKDGAILVGFSYAVAGKDDPPEWLQPIFLSPRGEVKGASYGTARNTDFLKVAKAKTGYAVGALYVRANPQSRLLTLKPIYMKITDKGLDTTNRYVGPPIGADGGESQLLGGDGNFIIGLHGKITIDNKVGALSVITLTTQEPPAMPEPKAK